MKIGLDEKSSSVSEPFHSNFVVLRKCVFACLPLSLLGKTLGNKCQSQSQSQCEEFGNRRSKLNFTTGVGIWYKDEILPFRSKQHY